MLEAAQKRKGVLVTCRIKDWERRNAAVKNKGGRGGKGR
jgi:hypothetical protein